MQGLLLSLLGAHVLLSVVNQFEPFKRYFSRWNRLSLLPYWSFFAPVPGTSDYRIIVRAQSPDGQVGAWSEICFYQSRSVLHLIWNPGKQRHKCISDCVSALLEQSAAGTDGGDTAILLSWPYLRLAQFAFAACAGEEGSLRQYGIVASEGLSGRKVSPLFLSRWHK